jgi:predicted dehydrogenase
LMRRGSEVLIKETLSNADAYSLMLDGFSDWVKGRGEYLAPGLDGLHNQRALDAAYQSWRDGVRIGLA